MDEFEHYNYEMDKHVNLSGHSGMYFYKIQHNQVEGKSSPRDAFKIKSAKFRSFVQNWLTLYLPPLGQNK